MAEGKKDEGGFKVTDKRIFTSDGSVRDDAKLDKSPPTDSKSKKEPRVDREAENRQASPDTSTEQNEAGSMDFGSFLLSLATTTLVHLGDVPDPSGAKPEPNLPAAKQMVDILTMLQKKSEGNRSADETRLLDDILYELRMRILAKSQTIKL